MAWTFLLHLDATPNDDSSVNAPNTVVSTTGVSLTTSYKKWGAASTAAAPAANSYIQVQWYNTINNGTSNFSVDIQYRPGGSASYPYSMGGNYGELTTIPGFLIYDNGSSTITIQVCSDSTTYTSVNNYTTHSVSVGSWAHIAAHRDGNLIRVCINGIAGNSITLPAGCDLNMQSRAYVCYNTGPGYATRCYGNVDEVALRFGEVVDYLGLGVPTGPYDGTNPAVASGSLQELTGDAEAANFYPIDCTGSLQELTGDARLTPANLLAFGTATGSLGELQGTSIYVNYPHGNASGFVKELLGLASIAPGGKGLLQALTGASTAVITNTTRAAGLLAEIFGQATTFTRSLVTAEGSFKILVGSAVADKVPCGYAYGDLGSITGQAISVNFLASNNSATGSLRSLEGKSEAIVEFEFGILRYLWGRVRK